MIDITDFRLTYDRDADAAYLYLTGSSSSDGRRTTPCPAPDGTDPSVLLDWQDGRVVGIEFLAASRTLGADVLAGADHPGTGQ